MTAADTSAWIDYARGDGTRAAVGVEKLLSEGSLVVPMPVLFEVLSGPGIVPAASRWISQLPRLEILDGFWQRAGESRRALLKRGLKARGMDCLIAQSCIDRDVPLLASDGDYRHFAKLGLKLA